jgi:hypothetical protein
MKPHASKSVIPAGIIKRAAQVPQAFALFIYLDSIPYCELAETTEKAFKLSLADWRKSVLPTLARSEVRYFHRDGKRQIAEVRF